MPLNTLMGTNISFSPGMFEDDFPFPEVGYVSSLEDILQNLLVEYWLNSLPDNYR